MTRYEPPAPDEDFYKPDEVDFIREQSGIHDPAAVKEHILAVQAKAYDLYSYPCIRKFDFVRSRISTFPAYQDVLALGREREGAILLDLGCCFGTDIRQAASDGFPVQNLIASDIHPEFWKLGHELFRSTPETFPVPFLAGDVFNSDFLEPSEPVVTQSEVIGSSPPLASLKSLTPLRGHIAAIHISYVFHLFLEPQQRHLACALAGLLSPVRGSVILGCDIGMREKDFRDGPFGPMVCHSPESWREMWEEVFPKGNIKVDAHIQRIFSGDVGLLVWSVTRV
ncbi:hypothetical protein FB451DRAFT_1353711 [Mycena latifolia]|nr:hypothetical protein FB451DRAFT_1353711 [Mycena latifolia]